MDPKAPQSTTQSPTPLPSPSKLPLILGTILLLGLVSIGSYILGTKSNTSKEQTNTTAPSATSVPQSDETANWKTYTGFRYSFKHPLDWGVDGNTTIYGPYQKFPDKNSNKDFVYFPFYVIIGQHTNEENLQENEWAKRNIETYCSGEVTKSPLNFEKFTFGQLNGVKVTGDNIPPTLISKKDDEIWTFSINVGYCDGGSPVNEDDPQTKSHIKILNQILSTFKFTDQSQTNETANWKTYTIKSLGIAYRLPPEITMYGEMKENINPGQEGTQIYITTENTKVTSDKYLLMGTTSTDYMAGRGGMFIDLQGFTKVNDTYYAKFVNTQKFEIPSDLVSEVINPNGIQVIKVKGENFGRGSETEGLPLAGSPGKGYIGAIININKPPYQGLALQMTLTEDLTEKLFDQILSTFKLVQ